jgi:hypothetical protein
LPGGSGAPKIAVMGTPRVFEEVKAALRVMLPELRARYGVSYLGVFGSWTRGEQTPGSDLDLLADFDRAPPGWGDRLRAGGAGAPRPADRPRAAATPQAVRGRARHAEVQAL